MAKNFQKKETTRRKPDPKIFRKHFAKFEEAIEGLREADAAIADIFAKDVDGKAVSEPIDSPKDAIQYVLNDFANYAPDLLGNENIYCSLNTSSNKLTYRINKEVGFGWVISYSIENKHAVINDVSVQIIVYDESEHGTKNLMLDLTAAGWDQIKIKTK